MSTSAEEFFLENTKKVNKTVQIILTAAILVPVALYIGGLVHLWPMPMGYCIAMMSYEIIVTIISVILNKIEKLQRFSMYFGVIAVSGFVTFLAYKGLVRLSISYAMGTIISCLYYNRPLTIVTCIVGYILSIFISVCQSFNHFQVVNGIFTQIQFIIQMAIGLTIEFIFLMIVAVAMARLSQRTMSKLMESISERDEAFERLQSQNTIIRKINSDLETTNRELDETQYKIIQFVAQCLGSHDLFTGRHVVHTQRYVEVLCNQLIKQGDYVEELDEKTVQLYKTSAFLHDIGKIHIPEGVLNKIGKFTSEEFELMKSHPAEGKKLLDYLPEIDKGDFNRIAKEMAYCHHEKWDGSGYPRGVKGTDIPLSARIMAAADVLDALISQRLYKDPMSIEEAMEVFKKSKGTHFEPCIADAVIACQALINLIDQDFKSTEASTNNEELEWWQRYHKNIREE